MGKLEDLRVERVDGVDRPATGHRFVIVKSERTPAQLVEELEKSESLTDEQRELLETLKASLVEKDEDESADEPEADESAEGDEDEGVEKNDDDEGDESESDDEPETETEKSALLEALATDEGKELLKSVIGELVEAELAETEEAEVTKSAGSIKSRQPNEQEVEKGGQREVKKGTGLFTNIIFGQNAR